MARGGQSYARLRLNVGPGGEIDLSTEVDFARPFEATDFNSWEAEYQAKVEPEEWRISLRQQPIEMFGGGIPPDPNADSFADFIGPTDWW